MTPVEAIITWPWRQSNALGDRRGHPPGRVGAGPAGEGVGAAGVDHQRADVPAAAGLQVALAPVDRRRADAVAGEDPGAGRPLGEAHQQHVVALVLVEPGAAARELDPGDRPASRGNGTAFGETARPGLPGGVAAGSGEASPNWRAWRSARRSAALFSAVRSGSSARSRVWPTSSAGLAAAGPGRDLAGRMAGGRVISSPRRWAWRAPGPARLTVRSRPCPAAARRPARPARRARRAVAAAGSRSWRGCARSAPGP